MIETTFFRQHKAKRDNSQEVLVSVCAWSLNNWCKDLLFLWRGPPRQSLNLAWHLAAWAYTLPRLSSSTALSIYPFLVETLSFLLWSASHNIRWSPLPSYPPDGLFFDMVEKDSMSHPSPPSHPASCPPDSSLSKPCLHWTPDGPHNLLRMDLH